MNPQTGQFNNVSKQPQALGGFEKNLGGFVTDDVTAGATGLAE